MLISQRALKYEVKVNSTGRVELPVPFPIGVPLTIFVIAEPQPDNFEDLFRASQSSLDFWDNSFDDEDWNLLTPGAVFPKNSEIIAFPRNL